MKKTIMTSNALLEIRHASTQTIAPEQRLAFWEQYNAASLVGLKCNSWCESGFVGRQDNLQLDELALARVAGNQHVVERDSTMIRTVPKESVFVALVTGSGSFFYQDGDCQLLAPGELIIYRTDKPYLIGFSGPCEQFIFDIPQVQFAERCLRQFGKSLKISADNSVQRLLLRTLGEQTGAFFRRPDCEQATVYKEQVFELLGNIIAGQLGTGRINALSASYLLAAKQCIQAQLGDSALSCERVALQIGISSRHLTRLFALEDTLPSRFILEQRLLQARELLAGRRGAGLDVSEIAYRHGFTSQAHFARAFKARFGITPSQAREACVAGPSGSDQPGIPSRSRATASAIRIPSTPADRMPPA